MQPDGAEGGVGNRRTAEGELEGLELWAAKREDLGGGVGEGAAEGLRGVSGMVSYDKKKWQ